MTLFKNKYRIESARLQNWDYGWNGKYFVTIVTKNRECYFGEISNGKMILNDLGEIAEKCWREIPEHFPFVILDEFIVMPNHVHGIIEIKKIYDGGLTVETQNFASLRMDCKQQYKFPPQNKFAPQSQNLGSIIRGFKIGVTKYANENNFNFGWQPRFYDHIIRDENDLNRIRNYIYNNPRNWGKDKFNL